MSVILLGVLSGMIFGALAVLLRRYAVSVILSPFLIAPMIYAFIWRDALMGDCFYASNFATEACAPFRHFLTTTVGFTGEMVTVMVTHLATATIAFIVLALARRAIARADLASPAEKEARREAEERAREAQEALRAKMERDLKEAMEKLEKSRQMRAANAKAAATAPALSASE